jgi:hypothetical protein
VLLSSRSKERLAQKVRELTPRTWGQSVARCIDRINAYLRGWVGFFGVCSPVEEVIRVLHSTDAHIRRRLRALLLRQWKRKRFIARRLIRMGIRSGTVWRALYSGRKSLWALSHCGPVDRALDKQYFVKRGLMSVEALYRGQPRFVIAPEQLVLPLG